MSEIRSGNELASLLIRANEIESAFENLSEWDAYVDVKGEEFREILFSLISESQKHKGIVNSMISMVNAGQDPTLVPLTPVRLDFRNKHELEIMNQIGRYERLAFDLYSDIREAIKKSDIKRLLHHESDAEAFISSLEKLVSDEREHVDLAEKSGGRVSRIT